MFSRTGRYVKAASTPRSSRLERVLRSGKMSQVLGGGVPASRCVPRCRRHWFVGSPGSISEAQRPRRPGDRRVAASRRGASEPDPASCCLRPGRDACPAWSRFHQRGVPAGRSERRVRAVRADPIWRWNPSIQKAIMLVGDGNGKSTFRRGSRPSSGLENYATAPLHRLELDLFAAAQPAREARQIPR